MLSEQTLRRIRHWPFAPLVGAPLCTTKANRGTWALKRLSWPDVKYLHRAATRDAWHCIRKIGIVPGCGP
eukprot:2223024-Pyramimonas_sp.AAC.1